MHLSDAVGEAPYLLGQILRWPARLYPDKPAIECPEGSVTYADLDARSDARALEFARAGVRRFSRIGLVANHDITFFVSLIALWKAGAVVAPLPARQPPAVRDDVAMHARLEAIVDETTPSAARLAGRADAADGQAGIDLDPALIMWSSGSGGRPRAVVLQHHAVLANIRSNVGALGYRDDDRTLLVLPLNHAYGLVHQCLCHLAIGATIVLSATPLLAPVLCRTIEKEAITSLATVPPILKILVEGAKRTQLRMAGLRLVTVGAATAPEALLREARSLLAGARIVITYGLTECGPRVTVCWLDDVDSHQPSNVGSPLPNVEVGVNEERPDGKELWVRSRSAMRSFADDPFVEGTDGRVFTADIGEVQDGEIHIRGRLARIINRGGMLIHAEEVEHVLLQYPGVHAARVSARPHEFWGEVPLATVWAADGVTESELHAHLSQHLAREKQSVVFDLRHHESPPSLEKERKLLSLFQVDG
jgi:acyl-CoA synthetase (AMP-forming)/AMP-acid ligase II